MKFKLLSAAAVGAILAAPSMAVADEGWYVSGALGYGGPGDMEVSGFFNGDIQGQSNLREKLALGYEMASGLRFEAELAHRFNDTGAVGNFEDSSSDFQVWSGMVNAIYDFDFGPTFSPYIGVGIGAADVNFSGSGWSTGTVPIGGIAANPALYHSVDDSDTEFAAQAFAGIGWDITDRITIDTEYRYFRTPGTKYLFQDVSEFESHEAWIGLRYSLAQPAPTLPPPPPPPPIEEEEEEIVTPPPPPPPPPVCEDVDFVVYFAWDRSALTAQARDVINNAIDEARNCGVASVTIDGHADRSGAAAYNVGLSERRARAVRDELVRLGVPSAAVSLSAFGESRPDVATPDGVREPLNRRAEVLIDLN